MAYLHKSVQEFQASAIYSCWKISDKNCHKIIPNYALMLDGISHTRKINVKYVEILAGLYEFCVIL